MLYISHLQWSLYYIDPIAYLDSGYWSTIGFAGTYYCRSNNRSDNQSESLFSCLISDSNYYYYYYYYCNNNRDTVSLRCNIDTSKL